MIANALAALFRPSAAQRTRPADPYQLIQFVPLAPIAGVRLTVEDALCLSVVWACVDAITKAVSSCRWNVYTEDGADRRRRLPNDPADYLLNVRPNEEMTAIGFREALLFNALTWGNGYAEIVRDGAGRIAALWPLAADRMTPRRDSAKRLVYEFANPDGSTAILEGSRVFHLRGPGLNGLLGDNIVARAAKSIALAMAAERFSSSFFGNGTVLGGVLEYPKTLDDAAYQRLKVSWEERFQGPNNAHKPVILEGGMKWNPISTEPEKSQLVESRKFQIEEICRWYGVPPHKVQHLERSTFNNIEHLGIEFVRDALTPWAMRLEQEADFKLFTVRAGSRFTKLDTAWLSYGDAKSRAEYYQIMRRIGVFSVNDILALEGRNTIGPEGDIRIVESAMTRLERVGEEPAKEEEPPPPLPEPAEPPAAAALPVVRDALVSLFESPLDRYSRRLANREADLTRQGLPTQRIAANLAEEKERLRPQLIRDCRGGPLALANRAIPGSALTDDALTEAAEAVEGGHSPRAVADRLVAALEKCR